MEPPRGARRRWFESENPAGGFTQQIAMLGEGPPGKTPDHGSFRVKSPNFQEIPHDPPQMFLKKLLKIPQCVLMTETKF